MGSIWKEKIKEKNGKKNGGRIESRKGDELKKKVAEGGYKYTVEWENNNKEIKLYAQLKTN